MAGDVTVTFDAVLGGNAAVKLDAIKAQLQALTGKTHTITVNVDSKGFASQINKIMGNAKSGSGAILGNIGNKGMLGSIKRQTAELQTQKQLVSQMRSAAASAYKAIDHSTALTSGQKTRALERTVQLMNDLNRASNAIANGRYNTPRTMRNLSSQVKNTEQYVSRLKAAEKAAVRAAAAEEKRAAAMNKTWSDAAANKQKAITNQVTDAAKQLANYQSRYQSLLNSTYGGTAQGGRSLNELKEWMNFGQSLFKNAQRATPFNVKGTGALRDLTGVLGELSSMYSAVEARAKSFAAAERAANSRWASAETAKQKSIASQLAASMKGISNAEKLYQKLSNSPMAGNKSLQNFGQQIAQVKQMAEAAGKIKLYDPQGATKLNQLASAVTGLGASYANIKAKADAFTKSQRAALSESKAFTRQAGSMQKRIETFMGKNPRLAGTTYEQRLQNLIGGMQAKSKTGTGTLNNLRAVEQQFNSIKKAAADAGKTGQTFGQSIVGAVKQFGGWMLITHSIMKTIQTIKNMIGTVRDLDTAMTELRRVTHETSDTYDQFYQGATKRAVDIGATLKDTIQASADFVKLGYDIQDAPGLADAALVYKNVGIGIEDISDASNSIISAMKAFQLGPDEAMSVVDKFNLVGNNFAISSAGIGEAIERSASAMASAGNTLDETIALITAGNEVVKECATCA